MTFKALLLLAVASLLATGCTSIKYGEVSYVSVFNRKSLKDLAIDVKSADGSHKVLRLKGYTNDQVEALTAITEAAVAAAVKSVKP